MSLVNAAFEWTKATFAPLGAWGLFVLAFVEASFFPIPPDFLLIILCLARPELALFFALVCTLGSVLGGLGGYGIGFAVERTVLERFFSHKKIAKVHKLFEKYEAWAVFIGGFTPLPYKLFTIGAGLFYVNIKKFVLASALGRALRFFLVAILIMVYGETMVSFIESYFNIFTIVGVIVAVVAYVGYKLYKKKR
ncbi:YqaA family protein [Nanoarchaeota archaeon]